jgi:hypothetical protein
MELALFAPLVSKVAAFSETSTFSFCSSMLRWTFRTTALPAVMATSLASN